MQIKYKKHHKIVLLLSSGLVMCVLSLGILSFIISKSNAVKVADSFNGNISELQGQLVLVKDGKLCKPHWIFRGEYEDILTGTSFDVETAIWGKVIKKPPRTK